MNLSSLAQRIKFSLIFMIPVSCFVLGVLIVEQIYLEKSLQLILIESISISIILISTVFKVICRSQLEDRNNSINTAFKQVQDAFKVAESSNLSKSIFISRLSHKVISPMNGIIRETDALKTTKVNKEQVESLDTISESARQLVCILNDLLDFSKIEAGKLTLDKVPFNLKHTISDSVQCFRYQASLKGLELVFQYDDNLYLNFIGDPKKFKRVFNNLLSNAIKFTNSGNVELSVQSVNELSSYQKSISKQKIKIEVKDSGIGIDKETMDKLFTPYYQGDNSITRQCGGTGLGLSICKNIIEAMGGTITSRSNEYHGTTFSIVIELKRSAIDNSENLP